MMRLPWVIRRFNVGMEAYRAARSVVFVVALIGGTAVEAQDGALAAERFQQLTRSSTWTLERTARLDFDTHHPQGMAVVGDTIYLSSVHVIDRAKGAGEGFLFELSAEGKLRRTLRLGEGAMYHPGGIDAYGGGIWVSVAEYRPDSNSIVYRVDTKSLTAREVFRFGDHLGGIAWDADGGRLVANSWGSRRFYTWPTKGEGASVTVASAETRANASHYVDYQDGQWLAGTPYLVYGGLASVRGPGKSSYRLGGMALIDTRDTRIVHEVPVPLYTDGGKPMNQNPFYCEAVDDGLRFYFIPDDNVSTLYVYRVGIR